MSRPDNNTLFIVGLLGIILLIPIANAETYKLKDSRGKIIYTDQLPTEEIEHEQIDVGECKTDKCRNELEQLQNEAAKQHRETEKWLSDQDAERKKQAAQQQKQSKSIRKQLPRRPGYFGY